MFVKIARTAMRPYAAHMAPLFRGVATEPSPKIVSLVDSIASLNLMETASLVALIKTKLNLADVVHSAASAEIGRAHV